MPKYLVKVRYGADGIAGVLSHGGSARRAHIGELAKGLGGSVESFYFAFGDDDAYLIMDLPDNLAMCRLASTVSASGSVKVTTVPLLTPEDLDAVAAAEKVAYAPPSA